MHGINNSPETFHEPSDVLTASMCVPSVYKNKTTSQDPTSPHTPYILEVGPFRACGVRCMQNRFQFGRAMGVAVNIKRDRVRELDVSWPTQISRQREKATKKATQHNNTLGAARDFVRVTVR